MSSASTGNCRICKVECVKRCSHCKKVYYCSALCQQTDRKSHKKYECFPCELIEEVDTDNDTGGRSGSHRRPHRIQYWITTRDLEENELIFSETSLISGPCKSIPNSYAKHKGLDYIPICLACHKILDGKESYNLCTRCKWPVCSTECQNDGRHSGRECSYLVAAGMEPRQLMEEYEMICILRTLLIKSKEPQKWAQIMTLKSTAAAPDYDDPEELRMQQWNQECQFTVFKEMMGLTHLSDAEIVHVTQLWTDLSVRVLHNPKISQRDLLYKSVMVAHSCLINTKNWTQTYPNGKQVLNFYATKKLPVGTKLTNSGLYGNVMLGTQARRDQLSTQFGFWCKCERCRDPTEMGTNLSAIICTNQNHSIEEPCYLLPTDPLDQNSDWKCLDENCSHRLTSKEILTILEPIALNVKSFTERSVGRKFEGLLRIVTPLPEINTEDYALILEMENYDSELEKILHPNHYLKFQLRKQILFGMNLIVTGLTRGVLAHEHFKHPSSRRHILERMYEISIQCSNLASRILPGLSLFRGKVLYFLAISRWAFIIETSGQGGSIDKMKEAKNQSEEATTLVNKIFAESGELGPPENYILVQNLKATEEIANTRLATNPTFASLL